MSLTIVMYHYVRRITESRYPEIKGLEREDFIEQLHYLKKYFTPVSGKRVVEALRGRDELPGNAVLLTFDDGYLDHFTTAFPLLQDAKVPAVFFPPAKCVLEREMLDVNKIHYTLASVADKSVLVERINKSIEEHRDEFILKSPDEYRAAYFQSNRFDPAEVIYVKRMLQVGLPERLRNHISDELFKEFVSSDQKSFAHEVYMDLDQARCMSASGMMFGSHGYDHYWLDSLSFEQQEAEIDRSLEFLGAVGESTTDWMMCYPYGAWNKDTLDILERKKCAAALTTLVGISTGENNNLLLPRLDTNDLPKNRNAIPCEWTIKANN
ncbi:hypothetical protein BK655_12180 [Pseudomonas brassicacearum]|uniref:polysaccharide deacetylase family protein n=1 Tax=Pseudomonas brassicacearum TaxID=930166 RepID=UPI000FED30AB|nr:polysaccharide deacetylase family protein [Pseudomonas brassicacearum]ROM84104.1 hypothetical protein BK655_12180 [Pseudomonas brassicacearum]